MRLHALTTFMVAVTAMDSALWMNALSFARNVIQLRVSILLLGKNLMSKQSSIRRPGTGVVIITIIITFF